MSEIKVNPVKEGEVDTIIAEDIFFSGTVSFDDSLLVKGKIQGEVKAAGELFVAEGAEVVARIEANTVTIQGKVKGDIFARKRVELFASAVVDGDITAPDIVMESGCTFNGICSMKAPEGMKDSRVKRSK